MAYNEENSAETQSYAQGVRNLDIHITSVYYRYKNIKHILLCTKELILPYPQIQ